MPTFDDEKAKCTNDVIHKAKFSNTLVYHGAKIYFVNFQRPELNKCRYIALETQHVDTPLHTTNDYEAYVNVE